MFIRQLDSSITNQNFTLTLELDGDYFEIVEAQKLAVALGQISIIPYVSEHIIKDILSDPDSLKEFHKERFPEQYIGA